MAAESWELFLGVPVEEQTPSSPRFWFLAGPEGLATIDHEGQRFVPVFACIEDLQRFGQRCTEQLSGYRRHLAAEPPVIAAFLELLEVLSLRVGIAGDAPPDGDGAEMFTILEPAALARTLTEPGANGP